MRVFTLLAALLVCAGAQAQTVYRCGPDGRVYSQAPCPEGRAINVSDERSEEQRAAAEARVRGEQARVEELARERRDREAVKPATAGKIDGRPARPEAVASTAKPSKKKNKTKAGQTARGDFVAVAPAKKTKKR